MPFISHLKPGFRVVLAGILLAGLLGLASCSQTKATNPPPSAVAQATPMAAATVPAERATQSPSTGPSVPSPLASSPAGTPPGAAPGANPAVPEMRHINGGKVIQVDKNMGDPNDMLGYKPTPTPTPAATPKVETVNGKIKQEWEAPAEFTNLQNPFKVTPAVVKQGKYLYQQRCEICHGSEGKGNGGYNSSKWKQSTNLTSKVVQANTDGELFYKVTTNRDRHPSSRIIYTEEERWAVVAFLRTLK